MNRFTLFVATLLAPLSLMATEMDADTIPYSTYALDEVTVISNAKVNTEVFELPGSVTLLGERALQEANVRSVKDISTLAVNLFIPDYGSRLITSAYIRGIGSRINSPAVGLSVNGLPYLDKSAYDCDLLDVARIEVLRGPQGTLYGRNTMAGLINIYTHSPLDKQGTVIRLGGGNYKLWGASAHTAHKLTNDLALSIGARYENHDGYFTNTYTGKSSGKTYSTSGRFQLDWRSSQRVKWSLYVDFEHSYQDGYPYAAYDKSTGEIGDIANNSPSSYKRSVLTTGLKMEYRNDYFYLTSTTGYQYLDDEMHLDQDFSPMSVFTLGQNQRLHALTQEVAFRGYGNEHWQWVTGVFGSYQNLHTAAPVDFLQDGVRLLIEGQGNAALAALKEKNPAMPGISLNVANENLYIDGQYKTPSYSLAVFGQVEAKRMFDSNFSAAVGARLEYEHMRLEHDTYTTTDLSGTALIAMNNMPMPIPVPFATPLGISGSTQQESVEFLPKVELKYALNRDFMAYATVARGYRSGGYNYQAFSNLIQAQVQGRTMNAVCDGAVETIRNMMGNSPMADKVITTIEGIFDGVTTGEEAISIDEAISYKPEHSWNYEIGVRGNAWNNRLSADLSLFYIDCRDQQISCVSGYGRVTRNSGRTQSYGLEASVQLMPVNNLLLTAAYGYTHATFLDYNDGENNYAGKFVPFAPMHSVAVTGAYTWEFAREHSLTLSAQFMGQGGIYWTEANDVEQPFYGLLDASLSYNWRWLGFSLWGKNLTCTRYNTFYFETMNAEDLSTVNSFAQQGRPITFGANVTFTF